TIRTPEILMIDEALATGDASFRKKSTARIEEIRAQAGTVFFVSHSLASVRAMCTRALWIDKGVLIADGDVDEVADAYQDFAERRNDASSGAELTSEGTGRRRATSRHARSDAPRRSTRAAQPTP